MLKKFLPWPRCLHRGFLFLDLGPKLVLGSSLLVVCNNDPEREVAEPQRKTQSRKVAKCKKETSRKVLVPRVLHLDPPEIKKGSLKRGSSPRRNLTHLLRNMNNSTLFVEGRFLRYCFLLFLIPSKKVGHPKEYERLEYHHQFYFLSSLLSCWRVSSSLAGATSSLLLSSVTSLYSASITNAWGYFFRRSSSLATISSLDN